MSNYTNKKVLLASMHKKEQAIQEPFENIVGCKLIVASDFNTDLFGTFSGETKRLLSAFDTLKHKAVIAANTYNVDYIISSEGSFGPHPSYMFLNSDTEMLLFYDRTNELFIYEYEISTDTNLNEIEITAHTDYSDFLTKTKFPSHALILKANNQVLAKGITQQDELEVLIKNNLTTFKYLKLETDMRAMYNPSRMKVINNLAYKLAQRVANNCIKCNTPGFGLLKTSGALICELCLSPTKIKKYNNYCCIKCDYTIQTLINPEVEFANPRYCDYCNP